MKAILETLLIIAMIVAFSVVLCALIGGVWFAIQPNHEADQDAARDPFDLDREFTEPPEQCVPSACPETSVLSVSSVPSVLIRQPSTNPTLSHRL